MFDRRNQEIQLELKFHSASTRNFSSQRKDPIISKRSFRKIYFVILDGNALRNPFSRVGQSFRARHKQFWLNFCIFRKIPSPKQGSRSIQPNVPLLSVNARTFSNRLSANMAFTGSFTPARYLQACCRACRGRAPYIGITHRRRTCCTRKWFGPAIEISCSVLRWR